MNVPLSAPEIGEREIEKVCAVLRSGSLSLGPAVPEFEEKLASFVGRRFAIATSSGTAALHLCVRALEIGDGDEVITTSFSFVASANCLLFERAVPVFVDIDPQTLNLDPGAVRRFLEHHCERRGGVLTDRRTGAVVKAILPVHVFGLPCDMTEMMRIADEYGLALIEDACEAIGAAWRGRRAGCFGAAAAFAFYPNKQMTTGEGGAVVTDDENIAELCRSMRNQGRDTTSAWLRHVRLGYNYRLSDIHAALGSAQLDVLDQLLEARSGVAGAYTEKLSMCRQVTLPTTPTGATRSWFVYVVRVLGGAATRDALMERLRAKGVACQAYFPAIHAQPYLASLECCHPPEPLVHTATASESCLALPFSSKLKPEQIAYVCATLVDALRELARPAAQAA